VTNEGIAGLGVSRETIATLQAFASELTRWSAKINLVARSDIADLWNRHIVDSAQLFAFADRQDGLWADLGSGGGLPGLVIAILARDLAPAISVNLVESDQRKATFLRHAARLFELKVQVQSERAEAIAPLSADILSARALAPLAQLLPLAERHLAPGGVAIFPKGALAETEIATAQRDWTFSLTVQTSMTSSTARLLRISAIQRRCDA
jgi:16S rRNA (guanine527-N7)-methyltransferase